MRTRHQNIGQWRATLYPGREESMLKITALIPTNGPGTYLQLKTLDTLSSPDYGLIFRVENAKEINAESHHNTYLCHRQYCPKDFPYQKIIIIAFLPGIKHSSLIALTDIQHSTEELP